MKKRLFVKPGLWTVGLCASPLCAALVIVDTSPGTGSPPSILGGYSMVAFLDDPSSEGTMLTELTPPPGFAGSGKLTFNVELEHLKVGSLWATWSHGYSGSVYYTDGHALTLTLPSDTYAFSLYIEPNLYDWFTFTVQSASASVTTEIHGEAGARYFGFYTDNTSDPLLTILVTQVTEDSDGFAVGEFMINGVSVPDAGFGALELCLGLCALAGIRRALS